MTKFFIVGAARAGTTWLYSQLGQHPDVHICPIKEPHYYAEPIDIDKAIIPVDEQALRLLQTEGRLHSAWIRKRAIYDQLMLGELDEKVSVEATVRYLHDRDAAHKIATDQPGGRVILIVRNPVSRLLSHARMEQTIGRIRNVDSAIRHDMEVAGRRGIDATRYIAGSFYFDACTRYQRIFGRNNVLILSFEEMVESAKSEIARVARFLGVTPFLVARKESRFVNASLEPRFPWLNKAFHASGMKRAAKMAAPKTFVELAKVALYRKEMNSGIKERTSRELAEIFADDWEETSRLLRGNRAWVCPSEEAPQRE